VSGKSKESNNYELPELKPDAHFITIPPELAKEQLMKGFVLNDPTGRKIIVNKRILEHWKAVEKN